MKSLKKGFIARLRKRSKLAHLTDEELNELIKLIETGEFDRGLILIQQLNRRRNLGIDSTAITSAFKNFILFFKGELEEGDLILLAEELNILEKQVKTLRGKIFVKIIHTMICAYSKYDEKHIKSFNELLEKIEKNQNVIDPYHRDWILMSSNVSLGNIYLHNGEYDSALNCFSEASSLNNIHNWKLRQGTVVLYTGFIYFL